MKTKNILPCLPCIVSLLTLANVGQDTSLNGSKLVFKHRSLGTAASLRGLHVVDSQKIWCSGSQGTIAHSNDGGKSWQLEQIKQATSFEFRDIQGFKDGSAVVLAAGSPARVYQYRPSQKSWKQTYHFGHEKIFFDAFGFWDAKRGIAFSDPIDDHLYLINTRDGGKTWNEQKTAPKTLSHEAGFAASGTCLFTQGKQRVWIGLGGVPSQGETSFARVVYSEDLGKTWSKGQTSLIRSESAGIFSLVFPNPNFGIAVGGDYQKPEIAQNNASLTHDGGKTWRKPAKSFPTGYRSCITMTEVSTKLILLTTGTNGTDVSLDRGESWQRASEEGFHAIAFVPGTLNGWATGSGGKIASFRLSLATQVDGDR